MQLKIGKYSSLLGILLVILFSFIAFFLSGTVFFRSLSLSPLIIGILLGMIYGNTLKKYQPQQWTPGIVFCSKKILRLAVILYGFKLTFQHIVQIGPTAVCFDLIIVIGTVLIGLGLAKLLKIDFETSLLTATGSAVCGAAAVLGTESVLNNPPYKTAIAVSTVVVFGTLSMFLYPLIYRSGFIELSSEQWAVYAGGTIHEVAHVVGAGNAMGEAVASPAIIVKMIRVIFLAPLLPVYSFFLRKRKATGEKSDRSFFSAIPWFAFGFILVIGFNSLHLLPNPVVEGINEADSFLLTMAMTALGMETDFKKFKEAGLKPFLLALLLFVWLMVGGYFIVRNLIGYF